MIPCIFKDRDPHKPYVIGRHIQYVQSLLMTGLSYLSPQGIKFQVRILIKLQVVNK